MNVEVLDVEYLEPEPTKMVNERLHRELRDVLVIDAVELVELDELERVRDLDDEDAVAVEQKGHGEREWIEVADVMKRVRRDNHSRSPVLRSNLAGQFRREV